MKKVFVVLVVLAMILSMAACGTPTPSQTSSAPAVSSAPPTEAPTAPPSVAPAPGKPYIAMISKGFQHKFWQTVLLGAQNAAFTDNVIITFEGPLTESDIQVQVDMLNAVLTKNPQALCLAALDTKSVNEQLQACVDKGIPVIGFDSGVPNPPAGSIKSTASTNNEAAGAVGADEMFKALKDKITAATTDKPVVIACLSQDATSASITGRTTGFVNEMVKQCETVQAGKVAVTGHDTWKKDATSGKAAVNITVTIAASTSLPDCTTAAQTVLQTSPLGIFTTNSGTVDGLLAATTDGSDLDRASGKYKDIVAIGFDSGSALLNAITKQYYYGAITQDPYQIGYQAVDLAVKVIKGETVQEVVDTGCKFYNSQNMNDPEISRLLYQ